MAWIKYIEEQEASGKLKEYYDHVKRTRSKIANILKVESLNPDALKAHLDLYLTLMFGKSGLTRIQREMIATVVSATNNCDYCAAHHGEALLRLTKNAELVRQIKHDFNKVDLAHEDYAMLKYAVKLTKNPSELRRKDIEELRQVGFDDTDILNINLIASYFNLVNRIARAQNSAREKPKATNISLLSAVESLFLMGKDQCLALTDMALHRFKSLKEKV